MKRPPEQKFGKKNVKEYERSTKIKNQIFSNFNGNVDVFSQNIFLKMVQ